LYNNGILADASGKSLAAEPQLSSLYTNAYLPASDQSP
jgi:hypothetical protein